MKTFKHLKSLFTALLLLYATVVSAHDFEVNGIYYNILSEEDKTVEVTFKGTSYKEYSNEYTGSVVIPESVTYNSSTYNITGIAELAFTNCYRLTSITIPNSVTFIGKSAFGNILELKEVHISDIAAWCGIDFADEFANPLQAMSENLYLNGNLVTKLVIPESVKEIKDYAFHSYARLTSITIPNSVTSIGDYAFSYCTGLQSIEIPNSVTNIGASAFYGCTELTSVEIPNNVTSIGDYTFRDCVRLQFITIPNSVTSIGAQAFFGCTGLRSVTIGNSVTNIGRSAFSGCTGLTSIEIPNSVTSIGYEAFYRCTGLQVVYISDLTAWCGIDFGSSSANPLYYANSFIMNNYKLIEQVVIPESVKEIKDYAFYSYDRLTSIEIPNSVTSIGEYAFYNCTGLTSIEIPNSVTSIGNSAFSGCTGLKTVINLSNLTFSKGSSGNGYVAYYTDKVYNAPNGSKEGDFIFGKPSGINTLVGYLGNATELTLPANYKGENYAIGADVFNGNTTITSITIPNSVTSIGNNAFEGCTELTSITIPNNVTSIGNSAFSGCTGLTSVTIGNSVTSIGSSAFNGCTGLKTVINLSNLTFSKGSSGNGYVAYYADKVYNAPNGSIEGDFIFGKPNGINTLVGYLGNATELTLPANYKGENYAIGADVFNGNTTITSITIPNSVTSIGKDAFVSCYNLTSVELPSSLTVIEEGTFSRTGLIEVTIPEGVTSLGKWAFDNSPALSKVNLPTTLTSIGEKAFENCPHLTNITIPNSVTSIGNSAFYNCTGLKTVYNLSNLTFSKGSNFYGYIAYYANRVYNIPNGSIDGDFIFGKENGINTLVGYLGNATELTLPANYKGENYAIGADVFKGNTTITSITIPNNVTSIGNSAFEGCTRLTSATIGNSVTSIGASAFYGCTGLTSIEIPNSVTSIGNSAFEHCTWLKTVVNLSNLTFRKGSSGNGYVAYYADIVYNMPNGSIEGDFIFGKPNGVNTLLYYLGNATKLTLPANYKGENYAIGADVFNGNTTITSITIPNCVTSIGNNAFEGCSGLTSIEIPNSVTSIGESAFEVCTRLTSITIPNSVTSIGNSAFSGCTGLTSVELPSSLTVIEEGTFSRTGLIEVTIPEGVTSLGKWAFDNCPALSKVNLPTTLTSIGEKAFENCPHLTNITIPNSVTSIGNSAFNDCTGLKEVHISDITAWCDIDFTSYNANPLCYAKNLYLNGELVTELVIPDGVKEIRGYAFYGCTDLTSITFPNSVTSIGKDAFLGCNNLTSVELPSSLTVIEQGTFSHTGLIEVTIPEGVTSLGKWAFDNCPALSKVNLSTTLTSIGEKAFENCTGLTSITIPNSVTSIGNSAFEGCTGLNTVYNLSNLTLSKGSSNNGYVVYYADNVYNIPNGSIDGDFIFDKPNGVNTLVYYSGNDTHIVLPDKHNDKGYIIGADVFKDCDNILSVTIGTNVESISTTAFDGCDNIAKVFWLPNTPPEGYEYLNGKINYVANNKYGVLDGEIVVTQSLSSRFEIDGMVFIPTSLAGRQCCVVDDVNNNRANIVIKDTVLYRNVALTVTDIMPYSFYKNDVLTTLTVNCKGNIGECAFYDNDAMTSVTLNNNGSIGAYAFFSNDAMNSVTLNNNGAVGESAFEGCKELKNIRIPSSVTSVGDYAFKGCEKLKNAIIGYRATELALGKKLFEDSPIDSLYIGGKITYLSEPSQETSPFCESKSLRTVVITDVENEIYDFEFYNCSGLKKVTVGDGMESIGRWAFSGCYNLDEFIFGSNVSSIGEEAFSDCSKMTKITSRALLPPTCGEQALDDIDKWSCTLYVPANSLEAYQAASQWNEFIFTESIEETYTLTYVVDGEVYATYKIAEGGEITLPETPVREGYIFSGWSEIPEVMPTEDVTITGSFINNTFTVTYLVNGVEYATDNVVSGNEITLIDAPEKDGYTFVGWRRETPVTIDIASNADAMLYTNAPCTNTQWGDEFKGWDILFDDNADTFFHSEYGNKQTTDGLDHYIRVDMGEGNEIGIFEFTYTNRSDNGTNAMGVAPKTIVVEGSNIVDGEYTTIATITNLSSEGSYVYKSDELGSNDVRYRYIRFRVTETFGNNLDNGHPFFAISEFGMKNSTVPVVMPNENLVLTALYKKNGDLTLPLFMNNEDGLPGNVVNSSLVWESDLLSFKNAQSGIRITVFETNTADSYNGYPVVALGELEFYDANNNKIEYNVTTNSLESTSLLDNINDGSTSTFYHSTWRNGTTPDGPVYLDVVFNEAIDAVKIKMVSRITRYLMPTNIGITANGVLCQPLSSGSCGENANWSFADGVLTISGYGDVTSKQWGSFANKVTSVVIEDGITSLPNESFLGFANLRNAVTPSSLTTYPQGGFSRTGIESIEIPEGATTLAIWAFDNCPSLTTVMLPSTVTSINDYVFENCGSLVSITVANETPVTVGRNVFSGISDTATLYVPKGAKAAYESAYGWNTIPNIVELIDEYQITYMVDGEVYATSMVESGTVIVPLEAPEKECYAFVEWSGLPETMPAENIIVEAVYEQIATSITIGQYGTTVYSSQYALDFSDVEGLKAYAATAYNTLSGEITMTRIMTSKAGVGIYLKGNPGTTYIVPIIDYSYDHSLNMLVGVLKKQIVNSVSGDGLCANYKYTILPGDATPKFYQYSDGSSVSAGKAYLQIPLDWIGSNASNAIGLRFDEGETTDIDEVKGQGEGVKTVYDLQGRPVEDYTNDIYIINGEKVLVK